MLCIGLTFFNVLQLCNEFPLAIRTGLPFLEGQANITDIEEIGMSDSEFSQRDFESLTRYMKYIRSGGIF